MTPGSLRTPAQKAELQAFARRLNELMAQRGMSPSDLARAIWGPKMDSRGRNVARNRDRVSHYTKGTQLPKPSTMKQIAEVFGLKPEELHTTVHPVTGPARAKEVAITGLDGNMAFLEVHTTLPMTVAVEIMALIAKARKEET